MTESIIMKIFYPVALFLLFSAFCTPPQGWKNKSRFFGPEIKKSVKDRLEKNTVRVLIYQGRPIKISTTSDFEFTNIKNEVQKGKGDFLPAGPGKLIINNSEFRIKDRRYYGDLLILEDDHKLSYVNIVPLEEYLISVVGFEMSPAWPLDALKAQAVVARTYVVQRMMESRDKLYDIGNTTKDQVYKGQLQEDSTLREAIKETNSQVIKYKGEIANVFFHSCCGGETASASEVWKEDIPYLQTRKCEFKESPEYNWEVSFSRKTVEDKLGISGIQKISIKERTKSKRVKSIGLVTPKGENEIPATEFRNRLGPEKIKSTLFGIKYTGAEMIIRGHGYGHGVGLCQWCAKIMVEKRSMKYRSILRYFFPGTSIEKI